MNLSNKKVILGVCGGITTYKSLELARLLIKQGAEVKVIMTKNAEQFIHPNSFEAITNNKVHTALFDKKDSPMDHINLAKWSDLIIIAPATASIISKLTAGLADDILTTVCIATKAKIIIAPSMNKLMWEHSIIQNNVEILKSHKYEFIMPTIGEQACGDYGYGRMQEPSQIIEILSADNQLFKGLKVLITAGGTREYIDPIRYISNESSGKMGYECAKAFHDLGAHVSVISGPTIVEIPNVNSIKKVTTANEMYEEVMNKAADYNIFISVAAVSDYTIPHFSKSKIKKNKKDLTLNLIPTKDILASVSSLKKRPFCIGFSAETDNVLENAKKKLLSKNLDLIFANKIETSGFPFNSDKNKITAIDKNQQITKFEPGTKSKIAREIAYLVKSLL